VFYPRDCAGKLPAGVAVSTTTVLPIATN